MPDDITPARRDDKPEESRRRRLSRTFDEDAELYDRARPGYPPELYDDLGELAGACPGSRVLEVGCGTGQATVPLAGRGCRITAVEAGPQMAAVARRNLAGMSAVEVVTAEFESWPLPEEEFDAVLSATAFHWIDPAVRVTKAANALGPGGALAVVRTQHVRGGTEEFFVEVQRCYERFDPETPPGAAASRGRRHRRLGPCGGGDAKRPVRPHGLPPLRAGSHVHHGGIPGAVAHLLRPPSSPGSRQERTVGVHRGSDRPAVRRPGDQAFSHRVGGVT